MSEGLRFSITRTRDDYIRAYRVFCWRSKWLKAVWLLSAAYAGYLALDLLSGILNGEVNGWSQAQGTVSLTAIILILFCYSYFIAPILGVRSFPPRGVSWNIQIDQNGITESSPQEDIGANWGMFSAAIETNKDFLLIRGRAGFRYYPKQNLDWQTIDCLRELIRNKISKAKLQKSSDDGVDAMQRNKSENPDLWTPEVSSKHMAKDTREPSDLDFKLTLTKDDYKRAYRLFMRRSRYFRSFWVIVSLVFLYFISGHVFDLVGGEDIMTVMISVFPLLVMTVIFVFFLYSWYPALVARSAPDVGTAFDINIGDAGIVVSSAAAKARLGWSIFTGAIETPDDFLLFRGGAGFNSYPKRMLTGPQEIERLRETIRKNIPKATLLST